MLYLHLRCFDHIYCFLGELRTKCQPAQQHTIMYDSIHETGRFAPLLWYQIRALFCRPTKNLWQSPSHLSQGGPWLAPISGRDSQGKSTRGPLRLQHNSSHQVIHLMGETTNMILQLIFHESNTAMENDHQWLILYHTLPFFIHSSSISHSICQWFSWSKNQGFLFFLWGLLVDQAQLWPWQNCFDPVWGNVQANALGFIVNLEFLNVSDYSV